MSLRALPPIETMSQAFQGRDSQFDGVFFTGVRTTGIFCRPSCPARKPKPEHVEYFASAREALFAGYRPCKRCAPMIPPGARPDWVDDLFIRLEEDPSRRWTDRDLVALGLDPLRVRRWFVRQYAMTFHAYQRAARLGSALGQIRHGADITDTAFDAGFESLSGFRDAFHRLFGAPPGRSRAQRPLVVNRISTPLGPMLAGVADDALYLLEFCDRRMLETQLRRLQARVGAQPVPGEHPLIARVDDELKEYFEGRRRDFSVPLATPGTEFQKRVWEGLRQIPYGRTASYTEQATRIGQPGAVRAVARANGDNRIAIIIPCHRVIGSDGEMCGYGGGIWRKRYLLDLERAHS